MDKFNKDRPFYNGSFDPKSKRKRRFKCYGKSPEITDYSEIPENKGNLVKIVLRDNPEPVLAFIEKVLKKDSSYFQKVYLQYENPFEGNLISEYVLPNSGMINRRNFSLSPKKTFHWDANKRRFIKNEGDLSSRDTKYL